MQDLNLKYLRETYTEDGVIKTVDFEYPSNFNFAYDVVDHIATTDPNRRAMVWCNPEGEEHIFSFGDMKYYSDKCANFLRDLGVKEGDRVIVILRRHYQFWFAITALHKLGAIVVPATFMLKEKDLEYRIKSSGAKTILCTDLGDIKEVVEAVEPLCDEALTKVLLNPGGGGTTDGSVAEYGSVLSGPEGLLKLRTNREGWHDLNAGIAEASADFTRVETHVEDGSIMYFSSGTSGNPKMVLHDYAYGLAHTFTAKHWHNVRSDEKGLHFTIADTGWGKAVWGKYYGQWMMEAAVLTYDFDRFCPEEMLQLIERYHVTSFCAPPTMYRLMVSAGMDGYDFSSLEHCTTAGEALNPDLYEVWLETTGLKMYEGFGQTETIVSICNTPGMEPKVGSMGRPNPMYELALLDEDGNLSRRGESGEICIRVAERPLGVMMEYYRDEKTTAEAMKGDWYHSGDLAWEDEDGYLWYVGRNDDVIKSSGYRIGPFEVESVLLEHDAVFECAVTAVPDEMRGFAVKATIVLAPGFEPSDELTKELQNWVKTRTAPYKFPRIVDYVDSLPKTVNGKIRRAEIRKTDARK